MIVKEYTILSAEGMHARPAAALVKLVRNFQARITLTKGEKEVRLNSVLSILSMMAKGGETVTVHIEGPDESAALEAIDHFFQQQLKDL